MKGLACLAAQTNYAAKKCLRVLTGLYRCVLSGQCIVTSVPMLGTMPASIYPRLTSASCAPCPARAWSLVLVSSSGLHIYLS